MDSITLNRNCFWYTEDPAICDDIGEPKGQCAHCGAKWYEHDLRALPESERESARQLQQERGVNPKDRVYSPIQKA